MSCRATAYHRHQFLEAEEVARRHNDDVVVLAFNQTVYCELLKATTESRGGNTKRRARRRGGEGMRVSFRRDHFRRKNMGRSMIMGHVSYISAHHL